MYCAAKLTLVLILLTILYGDSNCYSISNSTGVESQLNVDSARGTVPFNGILGIASSNVLAYSNGNDTFISREHNYHHEVYMGLKWQCVEFARRWLFFRKGCTFEEVDGADDIWHKVNKVKRMTDGQSLPLKAYENGSRGKPKNESFIIYKRSSPDMPYGHIAVIVDVVPGFIRVAEQNYDFHLWPGNYARQIPLVFQNGSFYIKDKYEIYGWMKVDTKKRLQPLDNPAIAKLFFERQKSLTSTVRSQATSHHRFQLSHVLLLALSLSCYLF